jgi:hypothetical protein
MVGYKETLEELGTFKRTKQINAMIDTVFSTVRKASRAAPGSARVYSYAISFNNMLGYAGGIGGIKVAGIMGGIVFGS